jgi:hypothetical protein
MRGAPVVLVVVTTVVVGYPPESGALATRLGTRRRFVSGKFATSVLPSAWLALRGRLFAPGGTSKRPSRLGRWSSCRFVDHR